MVPDDVGGRFSVLTAVGLLPIAAAGIDIDQLLKGAADARVRYKSAAYSENDVLRYAAARNIGAFEALGNGAILLAGAVASLAYFHFGARQKTDGSTRRFGSVELLAWVGRVFIGGTLGAIFAGVYAAALTALIERVSYLVNFVQSLLALF